MAVLSRLRPHWPALTLAFSASMLAAAHAFQRFGGLQPCPLCLDQRNWHWGVIAVSAAALILLRFQPRFSRWTIGLIGLVLLGSFGQALFHVAVEQHWIAWQCSIQGANFNNLDFNALGDRPIDIPACDEIAWSMFGISMAGYNAILSLLAAFASYAVALAPERAP
jgi:disulfide bond formation protein DsbB